MEPITYNLAGFTADELHAMLDGLNELPHKRARVPFDKIVAQANAQDKERQAPAEVNDAAT